MENPGGLSSGAADKFRITDAPTRGLYGISIQAGWFTSLVAGSWSEVYGPAFIGVSISGTYNFSASPFFSSISFLRYCAIEAEFDYTRHVSRSRINTVDTTMNQYLGGMPLAVLRYLTSYLGFVFRMGGGVALSSVSEERTFGSDSSYMSTDPFARIGAGLQWFPYSYFQCETRFEYCPVYYRGEIYHGIRLGFYAGTRL